VDERVMFVKPDEGVAKAIEANGKRM